MGLRRLLTVNTPFEVLVTEYGKTEYGMVGPKISEPTDRKMFPYEIVWPSNNTALACMNQCAKFGFTAAGVEVSLCPEYSMDAIELNLTNKCSMEKSAVSVIFFWCKLRLKTKIDCGDISDVTANNGVFGEESECATICPGDPSHICGGGNRLTTYYWNGVVNNWKTPANIGRYEVRSLAFLDNFGGLY